MLWPGLDPFIFFLIFEFKFKFKFIDFAKIKFKFKFKFIDFKKTKFKFKFIDFEKSKFKFKFKFIDFAKVEFKFKFKFINNLWADSNSNSKFKFNPTSTFYTKDSKRILQFAPGKSQSQMCISESQSGPARGEFRGYIVPGPGPKGGAVLKGPGRVQVFALSFGIAP